MNILPTTKRTTNALNFLTVFHQNGVVEGPMHYGSVESSPHLAMGSTLDPHNGHVAIQKRPKNLGVTAFASKSSRGDGDEVEDGSLPSTPDMVNDRCPEGDEVLESDTRQLITSFLRDFTGLSKPQWNESKPLSTMKRVVGDVLEKHRYAYNGMVNKLSLHDRGDDMSCVSAVAKSLFADGTTNWGRIASLVAFGAVVSQYLKEKGNVNCVERVGNEIATYLLTDQRDWLVKNNSWDGFVDFFRVADPESTVRNTLMAFAGVAGIGATLALLISGCGVM